MVRPVSRRRAWVIVVALLALGFVAFEVGVRALPPDAVQYSIQTINPVGPGSTVSGTVTDPTTVARWRAAMTKRPDGLLIETYIARWQGAVCSVGTHIAATYTFTWHGLPVAVVSSEPTCIGGYQVSSGGIPNPRTYIIAPPVLP